MTPAAALLRSAPPDSAHQPAHSISLIVWQTIKRNYKASQTHIKSSKQVLPSLNPPLPSCHPTDTPPPCRSPSNRLRAPKARIPTARKPRRTNRPSPKHPSPSLRRVLKKNSIGILTVARRIQRLQARRTGSAETRTQRGCNGRGGTVGVY